MKEVVTYILITTLVCSCKDRKRKSEVQLEEKFIRRNVKTDTYQLEKPSVKSEALLLLFYGFTNVEYIPTKN